MRGFVGSYWTPAGRRALFNLGGLVGCQVVSQGCLFGLLLAFTAGLGPERYAAVATVQAVQAVLLIVGTAGLPAVLVRELAAHPERRSELVSGYVTATAGCSLLVGLLAALTALLLPLSRDERALWWLVSAGNVFAAISPLPVWDADHRQAAAAVRQLPADVLALAAALVLWQTGTLTLPTAGLVLFGRWCGQWLLTAGGLGQVWPAWDEARALLRSGRPLLVAGLLYLIPSSGGVILLRVRAGDEPAALFGLANQLAAALPLIFGLFVRVVQPHVNGPHGLRRSFVWKLSAASAGVLGGLLLAGAVAGWAAFEWVIGPAYRGAYPVFQVLLAANAAYAVAVVVAVYLLREHLGVWLTRAHVAAVAAFAVAVLVFAPLTPLSAAVAVGCGWAVLAVGCGLPLLTSRPWAAP